MYWKIASPEPIARKSICATVKAKISLTDEQLRNLFDMLDTEFRGRGCDHTFRSTLSCLIRQKLPIEPAILWLRGLGVTCDCRALAEDIWPGRSE